MYKQRNKKNTNIHTWRKPIKYTDIDTRTRTHKHKCMHNRDI